MFDYNIDTDTQSSFDGLDQQFQIQILTMGTV
jgi:hypothetical protein